MPLTQSTNPVYPPIQESLPTRLTSNTAEPKPDESSSGTAETNVGAIVGGVIGGVVLLVLIVVLVYFFVIRKRKSGGDEDKRKNVESTDNKDNFTPPPVFYSKPHKPPKDESDGSTWRGDGYSQPQNGVDAVGITDGYAPRRIGNNNPTFTGDVHYASVDVSASEDTPPPRPKRRHELDSQNNQLNYLELDIPRKQHGRKKRNQEPVEYSEIQV